MDINWWKRLQNARNETYFWFILILESTQTWPIWTLKLLIEVLPSPRGPRSLKVTNTIHQNLLKRKFFVSTVKHPSLPTLLTSSHFLLPFKHRKTFTPSHKILVNHWRNQKTVNSPIFFLLPHFWRWFVIIITTMDKIYCACTFNLKIIRFFIR